MRCKKHPADQSCSVGVCASCLRQRLLAVIAAQAQTQALKALQDCRKSDAHLSFPRSVSPYISRRKSDSAATTTWLPHARHQLFYSTPQVGTNSSIAVEINSRKKSRISSLILGIFRSKPGKKDADPVSHPVVSIHSFSASPAWFPNIIPSRRKKNESTFSINDSVIRARRSQGRGLSPERNTDYEDEHCHGGWSGHWSDSQGCSQTAPRRTPASTHSKSLSGLTFSLRPLVRPSPKRQWSEKVASPEAHASTGASFWKRGSRKLVDLGRYPSY